MKKKKDKSHAQRMRELDYLLKSNDLKLSDLEVKIKKMQIEHHQKKMHLLEEVVMNLKALAPAIYNWVHQHHIVVQPKPSIDVQ